MTEQFIKIPVQLLKDEGYSSLSLNAVVLYSLLLDRLESSKKNGDKFKDENGEFYAVMTRDEIVDLLRIGKNKVPKIKKELIDHGLLEEKSRGSRTTLYYPQKLKIESGNVGLHALVKAENWSPETGRNDVPKSGITTPVMYQNGAQWSPETGRNDVPKSGTNQTNYNQTDYNQTALAPSEDLDKELQEIYTEAEQALGKTLSSIEFQRFLDTFRDAQGSPSGTALLRHAIAEGKESGAHSWNYIESILRRYRKQGIKTLDDLARKQNKSKRRSEEKEVEDWMNF